MSDSDPDTDEAFYDAMSSMGSASARSHTRSFFRDSIDSQKLTGLYDSLEQRERTLSEQSSGGAGASVNTEAFAATNTPPTSGGGGKPPLPTTATNTSGASSSTKTSTNTSTPQPAAEPASSQNPPVHAKGSDKKKDEGHTTPADTSRPVQPRHRRTTSAVSDISEDIPSFAVMTDPVTDTDLPSDIDEDDEMFHVKNLDTGDVLTLTQAAALFPDADPLSQHMAREGMAVFDSPSQKDKKGHPGAAGRGGDDDDDGQSKKGGLFSRLRKKGRSSSASTPRPENYVKVWTHHKSTRRYSDLTREQTIRLNSGPIWVAAFNNDAEYVATGGRDTFVYIWRVQDGSDTRELLHAEPAYTFKGHRADVLDIVWSTNNFVLSASMDKTVRLWHPDHPKQLGTFLHKEFVTSIQFHPLEDKLFVSGSLDKHVRIWNIPDGKVVSVVECIGFITAVSFTADASHVLVGSHNGTCTFYETKGLKHNGDIQVRSARGKNAVGRKITGIVCSTANHALITTNDSRIRLYDMATRKQAAKYKGLRNNESQIRASFDEAGEQVICGSEDEFVYVWDFESSYDPTIRNKLAGYRKDHNSSYEFFSAAASEVSVTVARFVPDAALRLRGARASLPARSRYILTADARGNVSIFLNAPQDSNS